MSNNQIVRISIPNLAKLSALNALILNHNQIASLERDTFSSLKQLNTLVLSHNKLPLIPDGMLVNMTNLKKLSLAHNGLKAFPVGLPPNLQELRLNDNKIPTPSTKPSFPISLTLLDVGNNLLNSLEPALGTALGDLPNLVNLNLKGNAVCDLPGYRESVLLACSEAGKGLGLKVLDGKRFDEKFLERKRKKEMSAKKKESKEKKKAKKDSKGEDAGSDSEDERPVKASKRARDDEKSSASAKRVKLQSKDLGGKTPSAKPKLLMLAPAPDSDAEGKEAPVSKTTTRSPERSESPVSDSEAAARKKTRRGKRGGKGGNEAADGSADRDVEMEAVDRAPTRGQKNRNVGPQKLVKKQQSEPTPGRRDVARKAKTIEGSDKPATPSTLAKKEQSGSKTPGKLQPVTKDVSASRLAESKKGGQTPRVPPNSQPKPKETVKTPQKTAASAPASAAKPVARESKSDDALLAARSGVVAVIDNTNLPGKGKKKAVTTSAFDPSALETQDEFAVSGWD